MTLVRLIFHFSIHFILIYERYRFKNLILKRTTISSNKFSNEIVEYFSMSHEKLSILWACYLRDLRSNNNLVMEWTLIKDRSSWRTEIGRYEDYEWGYIDLNRDDSINISISDRKSQENLIYFIPSIRIFNLLTYNITQKNKWFRLKEIAIFSRSLN